ncbi:hypothetical protein ACFPM0_27895 [Pseudonocardia sulfidoxydans]|uniref:hypothetical protein n=1 Tax=Pseudonocardia sulfidoxydans TaxID=54011 RepID=UPI003612C41C
MESTAVQVSSTAGPRSSVGRVAAPQAGQRAARGNAVRRQPVQPPAKRAVGAPGSAVRNSSGQARRSAGSRDVIAAPPPRTSYDRPP